MRRAERERGLDAWPRVAMRRHDVGDGRALADSTVPTLYRNGRVDAAWSRAATAFTVDGGTITWIGADPGPSAGVDVVDLDGAFVAPAFVDAHVHATATGLALTGLDLRHARSVREVLDAVERATRTARGRPILGGGWDETDWPEQRAPTAAELDRAAYGGAVYLARVDVHSARRVLGADGGRARARRPHRLLGGRVAARPGARRGARGGVARADRRLSARTPSAPPCAARPNSGSAACTRWPVR